MLEEQGFAMVPHVIDQSKQQELIEVLGPISRAGARGMLSLPVVSRGASLA